MVEFVPLWDYCEGELDWTYELFALEFDFFFLHFLRSVILERGLVGSSSGEEDCGIGSGCLGVGMGVLFSWIVLATTQSLFLLLSLLIMRRLGL